MAKVHIFVGCVSDLTIQWASGQLSKVRAMLGWMDSTCSRQPITAIVNMPPAMYR